MANDVTLRGILNAPQNITGDLSQPENIVGSLSRSENIDGQLANATLRRYSAYEIAVQHGFVGTEEEWLASLAVDYATDTTPGIMKLYDTTGENTDGAMTQRSVTHAIVDNSAESISADDLLEILV